MALLFLNKSMEATQDAEGNWVYKAVSTVPFKKDGTLRKHHREKPRYKAIIQAEDAVQQEYDTSLTNSVREMAQTLATFGK